MIHGPNFNGLPIPPGIKRQFPERVRIPFTCKCNPECVPEKGRGFRTRKGADYVWGWLAGVGQSPRDRDLMLIQATNGHRALHVEERRNQVTKEVWYGIYIY